MVIPKIFFYARVVGERLIESFMLAANETVARHYHDLKLPFIYRIHEQPKEEKCNVSLTLLQYLAFLLKEQKKTFHRKIYKSFRAS